MKRGRLRASGQEPEIAVSGTFRDKSRYGCWHPSRIRTRCTMQCTHGSIEVCSLSTAAYEHKVTYIHNMNTFLTQQQRKETRLILFGNIVVGRASSGIIPEAASGPQATVHCASPLRRRPSHPVEPPGSFVLRCASRSLVRTHPRNRRESTRYPEGLCPSDGANP